MARPFNTVPEPQKRAVVYIRVSRDPDMGDPRFEKVSPDAQLEKCRQKIEQEGWNQGPVFADLDVSHSDLEHRVKWQECLEELRAGDILVVYEQTRVSRSRFYWENFYASIKERGIALCLLNLNLDTTTPEGEFFLSMSWGLSQLEVEILKRRIRDGKEKSRELGRVQGGPRIFGLEPDREAGKGVLKVVPEEAKWVRFAFEKRAEGWSYPKIARHLRDNGVEGPGVKEKGTGRVRKGPITSSVIARWTRQTLYISVGKYAGQRYAVNIKPVVSQDLWDRVQVVNAERSRKGIRKSTHLMSGLCRCSKCGEVLTRHRRADKRITWVCSMRQNSQAPRYDHIPKEERCKGVFLEEHILETFVLNAFFAHLDLKRLQEEMELEEARRTTDHSLVYMLRRNIDTLKARQDRLLEAFADGAIGKEELARQNDKYRAELERLEQELEDADIEALKAKHRIGKLKTENLKGMWDGLSLEAKKSALALFIEKVVVYPGKQGTNRIVIQWTE